jgi:multidrug efflux pump
VLHILACDAHAAPLALDRGIDSELRRPLGVAIVGGLIFSPMLTLYTTPVMYPYLDRLRVRMRARKKEPLSQPA